MKKKIEEVDERTKLVQEIVQFIKSTVGMTRLEQDKALYMFSLYNKYFEQAESNWKCDLCAIRIFSKLNEVANNYITTGQV